MIINPKLIYEKEVVKAASGFPAIITEGDSKQIQQNGIDLRISNLVKLTDKFMISEKNKQWPVCTNVLKDSNGFWFMEGGSVFSAETMEEVKVPEDMCAMVIQRSSLNRGGVLVSTGLWDSGFHGRLAVTMRTSVDTYISYGTRICQIIFMRANAASLYDGQYQGQKSSYDSKL